LVSCENLKGSNRIITETIINVNANMRYLIMSLLYHKQRCAND
jgi:hypothetical protein